jgi:hypothetical protein
MAVRLINQPTGTAGLVLHAREEAFVSIPPDRRDILKILPPELIAALRQPLPDETRRQLIHEMIGNELVRIQALRYVEELRLAADNERPDDGDSPDAPDQTEPDDSPN